MRLCYKLAGICGVAPGPLTLRVLGLMADARSRDAWGHTAAVLAMLANCHRDPRKCPPFTPADFLPPSQSGGEAGSDGSQVLHVSTKIGFDLLQTLVSGPPGA